MDAQRPEIDAEVCVLGSGPHGLAAALHLLEAEPGLRLAVLDRNGAWLRGWHDQLARAEITVLRSPIVHHPASEPSALAEHVTAHKLSRSGLPYDPPTAEAFASFCAELIVEAGLDAPIASEVQAITSSPRGVRIETDREMIRAEHLVVAGNPHRRRIPEWVWPLLGNRPGLFEHGNDVDLRSFPDLDGERVVILGGGMTAAHLACGAAARGADVHLVTRRPVETRGFDTDPGWLGPKYLRAFDAEPDPQRRYRRAVEARGGGTIPPWLRRRLDAAAEADDLAIHDGCGVRAADVDGEGVAVLALGDQSTLLADRVWLATGTTPDLGALRCLGSLVADLPLVEGLPVTESDLRLGSHPVYVTGRLATLTLGPAAGNLWGAPRTARRITHAITGVDLALEPAG